MRYAPGSLVRLKNFARPCLVISVGDFERFTNRLLVCPVVDGKDDFPLHIQLRVSARSTKTVLAEYVFTCSIGDVCELIDQCDKKSRQAVRHIVLSFLHDA